MDLSELLRDGVIPARIVNTRYPAAELARAISAACFPVTVDQLTDAMRAMGVGFEEASDGTRWFYLANKSPMLRLLRGFLDHPAQRG